MDLIRVTPYNPRGLPRRDVELLAALDVPVRHLEYNGKSYGVPEFPRLEGYYFEPERATWLPEIDPFNPIMQSFDGRYDLREFRRPRIPASLGYLNDKERHQFDEWRGAPRVLDMPIKFPGSGCHLPRAFGQLLPIIQRAMDAMFTLHEESYDRCWCYLSYVPGFVRSGTLQREAPCHVDGFQGALWHPKRCVNHTIFVANALPTVYYPMPFNLNGLDVGTQNVFWEFNRQVAATNSAYVWRPDPYELHLIDGYTVHRGDIAPRDMIRSWLRLSFEERIFNRLGNAHNPLFDYDWQMCKRDIEGLGLEPFRKDGDPTLRVFPWQKPDGTPWKEPHQRTQPNLTPGEQIAFFPEAEKLLERDRAIRQHRATT